METTIKGCENLSDREIITRIRQGDTNCATFLVEKYSSFVEKIAKKYYINGADQDDVIQEAFLGFYEAVKNYQCDSSLPFQNFAFYCIKKNIYDAISYSHRKKRFSQEEVLSLDSEICLDDKENRVRIIEQIANSSYINPEDVVIIKDMVREIVAMLSKFERKILLLSLDGKSYEEIANIVNKNKKVVGNALQRARKKIKQYLLNEIKK